MPTLVSEVFQVESTVSILTGVALPIFFIIATLSTYTILKKTGNNVFGCLTAFFLIVAVLLALLRIAGMDSAAICVAMIAISVGLVHGINLLQTSYIPVALRQKENISFLSGLLNSATYLGSAVSTYLFAQISDNTGWGIVASLWAVLAFLGAVLSLSCAVLWRRHERA